MNDRRNESQHLLTAHPVGVLAGKFRSSRWLPGSTRSAGAQAHGLFVDHRTAIAGPQNYARLEFRRSTLRASDIEKAQSRLPTNHADGVLAPLRGAYAELRVLATQRQNGRATASRNRKAAHCWTAICEVRRFRPSTLAPQNLTPRRRSATKNPRQTTANFHPGNPLG